MIDGGINMKKGYKGLFTVAIMCFCMFAGGITVHAERVYETDPNDTKETAQLIQANRETAAEAVNGTRTHQYVVNGYTSTTDDDWYKVYLTAGTQYVNCNGDAFVFEVYDPNDNLIESGTYAKSGFGSKGYPFEATTAGYYYVKITGTTSSLQNYILGVGDPVYTVAKCEVEFDTVTMANRADQAVDFDLSLESRLPEDAVVYMISMNGVRTTTVNSVAVTNGDTDITINLTKYSWDKSGLVSMNLPLKSDWSIDFGYYKDTTFAPSIILYYAYPVVSEYVDDIVITQ